MFGFLGPAPRQVYDDGSVQFKPDHSSVHRPSPFTMLTLLSISNDSLATATPIFVDGISTICALKLHY